MKVPTNVAGLRTAFLPMLGWFAAANVVGLFALSAARGRADLALTGVIALLVSVLPIRAVLRRQTDFTARLTFGIALTVYPALLVFALQEHPWQMDAHMYFFVCLCALTPLWDWRPIVLAATLIAFHHLILLFIAPDWVFTGAGNFGRVLFHAAFVILESGLLIAITLLTTRLIRGQAEAEQHAQAAAGEAQAAQERAEQAFADLAEAQEAARKAALASSEAETRAAEAAALRRNETAEAIEQGIGHLVGELGHAVSELGHYRSQLMLVTDAALARSAELQQAGTIAVDEVSGVAASTEQLARSIEAVGANTQAAEQTARIASGAVVALEPALDALDGEIEAARDILDLISRIAANSSLLALNARIEAARSGEAGAGFAVVANEMKGMAIQSGEAAARIAAKLESIRSAAGTVIDAIQATTSHVAMIDGATAAIADTLQEQIVATSDIARTAESVTGTILHTIGKGRELDAAVVQSRATARRADEYAAALAERSDQLGREINRMLAELRAA